MKTTIITEYYDSVTIAKRSKFYSFSAFMLIIVLWKSQATQCLWIIFWRRKWTLIARKNFCRSRTTHISMHAVCENCSKRASRIRESTKSTTFLYVLKPRVCFLFPLEKITLRSTRFLSKVALSDCNMENITLLKIEQNILHTPG